MSAGKSKWNQSPNLLKCLLSPLNLMTSTMVLIRLSGQTAFLLRSIYQRQTPNSHPHCPVAVSKLIVRTACWLPAARNAVLMLFFVLLTCWDFCPVSSIQHERRRIIHSSHGFLASGLCRILRMFLNISKNYKHLRQPRTQPYSAVSTSNLTQEQKNSFEKCWASHVNLRNKQAVHTF